MLMLLVAATCIGTAPSAGSLLTVSITPDRVSRRTTKRVISAPTAVQGMGGRFRLRAAHSGEGLLIPPIAVPPADRRPPGAAASSSSRRLTGRSGASARRRRLLTGP
jgi:hypothetical protein